MKKTILLQIASIMTAVVMILCFVKVNNTDEMALAEVFQDTQYYEEKSDVETSVYYGETFLTADQKEKIVCDVAHNLGINDDYNYNASETDTGSTVELTKQALHATTTIKLTTVETNYANHQVSLSNYLYIRIDFDNSPQSTVYYKEKIENVLKKMKLNGKISMNFISTIPGRMSMEEKSEATSQILEQLKARIVDSKCTEGIFTVYGYTEYLEEYIYIEGNKANINIAFSYNENENVTEMYVSAPLISRDY